MSIPTFLYPTPPLPFSMGLFWKKSRHSPIHKYFNLCLRQLRTLKKKVPSSYFRKLTIIPQYHQMFDQCSYFLLFQDPNEINTLHLVDGSFQIFKSPPLFCNLIKKPRLFCRVSHSLYLTDCIHVETHFSSYFLLIYSI